MTRIIDSWCMHWYTGTYRYRQARSNHRAVAMTVGTMMTTPLILR